MRDTGSGTGIFELIVMLAVAFAAFAGAPYYVAILAAVLMTLSTLQEYAHLHARFVRAGAIRLMAGGVLLAATTSLVFASLCFAVGRLFAWLIAG
jgi:general stress protein CsbA